MTDDPPPPLRSIVHPTDFSVASELAFDHALRIALSCKARLHLLHVGHDEPEPTDWLGFPGVRRTLSGWGLLPEGSPREASPASSGSMSARSRSSIAARCAASCAISAIIRAI